MLVVGLLAGFFIARGQTSDAKAALEEASASLGQLQTALTRSEDRNWTYYRTIERLEEQLEHVKSSTSTTFPSSTTGGAYGPGIYMVGENIPAGTYDGVLTGSAGYWARLRGTDGAIASIIENGIPRGPFVLTIEPGDTAIELRGVMLTARP
jgi:hypothetical protein